MDAANAGAAAISQVRKLAGPDAVHRRRMARKLRKQIRERERGLSTETRRQAREQIVVLHMLRRFVPSEHRHVPLFNLFEYWQARKCGWDATKPQWRQTGKRDAAGEPILCDPEASPMWVWWLGLDWWDRYAVSGNGRFTKQEEPEVPLSNPAFVIEWSENDQGGRRKTVD